MLMDFQLQHAFKFLSYNNVNGFNHLFPVYPFETNGLRKISKMAELITLSKCRNIFGISA